MNEKVSQISVNGTIYDIEDGGISSWAKASSKPSYSYSEISGKPSSLPASDVYSWAKASSKPSYTLDEVTDGATRTLFSGSYNDLTNKPTIPSLSGYATLDWVSGKLNDILGINASGVSALVTALSDSDTTTGILTAISGKVDKESGKSLMTDAERTKLSNIATGATAVTESTVSGWGFTKNTGTSTFSGSYNDLTDKPTIPAALVQTDWNATSGMGVLLNKPSSLPASDVSAWAKESTKPNYAFSELTSHPTTLSGYGITDASIVNGVITLGSNTITPLTSFTETDPTVPSWAKASSKPSYGYGEITYSVNTASTSGAISLDGSTYPLHVITLTGNASSVALSANPATGHSCHVIFACGATSYTVAIAHDSTNRICPEATDLSFTVPANGYVEVDFLNANNKIYVRGV